MEKYILKTLVLMFTANISFAQTATDFTADDCNGVSHHLFDELDAGNVIVLCWVMPCGPCATGGLHAQDAVQSFATSHPGQVRYYMADDFANSTCSYLDGWAASYQLVPDATFSDASIDMNDYGGPGMPKVVVIGPDYQVYYNGNNNQITKNGVIDGINQSLSATVSISENTIEDVIISSHTSSNSIDVSYTLSNPVSFQIFNTLGEVVKRVSSDNLSSTTINIQDLSNGIYILQMKSGDKIDSYSFVK